MMSIGSIGKGEYNSVKDNRAYMVWKGMLDRCYNEKYRNKYKTYIDCEVYEEWFCFQNFAEWFYENYYEIEGEEMHLDKDILIKGNKIYSPDTCVFVPKRINSLFTKCDRARGNLPVGVRYRRDTNKFRVECSTQKNGVKHRVSLGQYDTVEEAFEVYKQFKENYIKEVAEEYKHKIPVKLYEALINYKVEITD